jgi:hypothetical protein
MPVHDWTRVEAGIFHDFHHGWIEEIKRTLNRGLLPEGYYALAEQHAAGFGPDVLTLETTQPDDEDAGGADRSRSADGSGLLLAPPPVQLTAEGEMAFYRRKQSTVTVRHVSGDRIVAVVEIVSPGNKASRNALRSFVDKVAQLLDRQIHLLILDLYPPTRRDPEGIHGAIWEDIIGEHYEAPEDKPLTLAAYESALSIKAYVVQVAVGDTLPAMPLFLLPEKYVLVPLEATYQAAYAGVPRRWQRVLEGPVA